MSLLLLTKPEVNSIATMEVMGITKLYVPCCRVLRQSTKPTRRDVRVILTSHIVRTAKATQIQMRESCRSRMSGNAAKREKRRFTFEYISCATASESSQWQTMSALT